MKRYMCKIACTAFSTSIIEFSSELRLMFTNIQLKDSSDQNSSPFLVLVCLIGGIDAGAACELVTLSR